MPPKIRELINKLISAGFISRSGKGSHRVFVHANLSRPVVISGNPGDDAKKYQEKAVKAAVEDASHEG